MLTCGIDIGARTVDVVVLDGERVLAALVADTGPNPRESAEAAFREAIARAGLPGDEGVRVTATGYGRNHFARADATVSEISAHAAGVALHFPGARLVVDIGGQDSKAILVGPGGRPGDFAMNDRCAAGTGKFLEIVARTLAVPLEETGPMALASADSCEISSVCAVFAETEIVGLLHGGAAKGAILRGVFRSVAKRTHSLLARLDPGGPIVFTGGVAKNSGMVRALEEETGRPVRVPPDPQLTGALGAALLGSEARG